MLQKKERERGMTARGAMEKKKKKKKKNRNIRSFGTGGGRDGGGLRAA
jgi:hypothetical protein